jgi:hypothetical protein
VRCLSEARCSRRRRRCLRARLLRARRRRFWSTRSTLRRSADFLMRCPSNVACGAGKAKRATRPRRMRRWCSGRLEGGIDNNPNKTIFRPSRRRGRLPEASRWAERDAASCGSVHASRPPGGARAAPPSRHYERDPRMRQCETEGHRSCATPNGIAKAGLGPKNRRGGAPRGERPPARGLRKRSARGRAGRHWSAHIKGASHAPGACRRSAPSRCVSGRWQSSGDDMPRENDDARPVPML